ncbi:MAG: 5-methyltetrahydropteroyltriglutamate--homocysteine S-methyltransferase [Betaproteobacteria bacterium]|nr:5-methyltetrahydropteroyltriglutamate--homocysteine S-methyltransferase [Betaproteobacteria bacterium]
MNPPFRAEQIGSLLRPKALLDAWNSGADRQRLRELEDEHIASVIRWQESLGLRSITDGEFRRESWRLGFVSKVAGFGRADAIGEVDLQRDDAGNEARIGSAPIAVARVRRTGPIAADEVVFALKHARGTVKATLPAPSYLHYPRGDACVDPNTYPDLDEFFADVVEIYAEELAAVHAAGGRYVQFDEVAQTLLCDERIRAAVRARGDDPDRLIDLYIDLINRIARRRPEGMTIGVHMCRGNAFGKWMASGGYERIAEKTFSTLEVDAFFLEYDTIRAGGFEPLRFVPKDRFVVLGLVSTKTPKLESMDDLKQRIEQAAAYVPLERLGISPQCGFASHRRGTGLTFAEQEAKLRLVVETAAAVWGAA